MNRQLERLVEELHAQSIEAADVIAADAIERCLRTLDDCANDDGALLNFIDGATWIAEQDDVPILEKRRALIALAGIELADEHADLSLVGDRIIIELVQSLRP